MSKHGRNRGDSQAEAEVYARWRRTVFEHDRFTCQACKDFKPHLSAHHLYNFTSALDKQLDVENGVTLCDKCHQEFHEKYGYIDNTPEQFVIFQQGCIPFYDRVEY